MTASTQETTPVQLRLELQENPVADEVSAITAVVRPILSGILYALKHEVVAELGGHDTVKLFMLPRAQRRGDGDVGICFEYAVHDALARHEPAVSERVADALKLCNLPGQEVSSILFGAEKQGALNLIDTALGLLTPESRLHAGTRGQPVKLIKHIAAVAAAFRRPVQRTLLPQSISGLWKADLFTGRRESDRWIGTTLKVNRRQLASGRGLRIGIVPADEGESDSIVRDENKNLVVCPLPYDASFMQVFYQAWEVVLQFLNADAQLPREVDLPRPASRQVARYLEERRAFNVVEVIEALEVLSQPGLLRSQEQAGQLVEQRQQRTATTAAVLAPIALSEAK